MARIKVNGEICMALLDNGMQINTITPGYVKNYSLDVKPLSDLVGSQRICVGMGNTLTNWLCHHMDSSRWSQEL